VEVLGTALGVAPVGPEASGGMAPRHHAFEHTHPGARGIHPRTLHQKAGDQVGMERRGARSPSHGDKRRLERPEQLAQRSAVRPGPLPVVALPHIPAPVGIGGTDPGSCRGAPGEERHRRGVEAETATEAGQLLFGGHRHGRSDEVADRRLQEVPPLGDLLLAQDPTQRRRLLDPDPAVLHLCGGIHHREHPVEQVAHPAIAGEEGPGRLCLPFDPEQGASRIRQ
jgi:hypothetical protein